MEINKIVADNILKLRKQAGLSQLEFSVRAEITTGMLCAFEHANGNPKIKTLDKIANVLGVPLYRLFENDHYEPHKIFQHLLE